MHKRKGKSQELGPREGIGPKSTTGNNKKITTTHAVHLGTAGGCKHQNKFDMANVLAESYLLTHPTDKRAILAYIQSR